MLGTLIALLLTYLILWALFRMMRPGDSDIAIQQKLDRARDQRMRWPS